MLENLFRSKEEAADLDEAFEVAERERNAEREAAHKEWMETPWVIQETVTGRWAVYEMKFNWLNGQAWRDNFEMASFLTKEKALEAVHRLANPQIIPINRDGTPKEVQS